MKKSLCAGLLLAAVSASAALAGALEDRQALMKQFNLDSKLLSDMARGTTPFNATAANIELQALVDGAARIPGLFPAGSNMDSASAKTLALPTVWSDTAGFQAAAAKLGSDAKAAMAADDKASFATAFQTVQADCNACHKTYRAAPPPRPAAPNAAPSAAPAP
jgi:cytochrome c556